MGKAIEKIALERGHEVVFKTNHSGFTEKDLNSAEVAIEFTTPDSAVSNIKSCTDAGIPIVVGTTAWYDQFDEVSNYVNGNKGGLFTATKPDHNSIA